MSLQRYRGTQDEPPTLSQIIQEIRNRKPEPPSQNSDYLTAEEYSDISLARMLADLAESLIGQREILVEEKVRHKNYYNQSFAQCCALLNKLGGVAVLDPFDVNPSRWGDYEILSNSTLDGNWRVELKKQQGGSAE